ncbi:MAG: Na+/H+ antiporter NhaC [Bacteroidales bacterium]|nr:Na+/H+ antiporter NhaC [Bacteroidales bacterium]
MKNQKEPGILTALTPIVFLVLFLSANVIVFEDTLAGSNQMILLFAATIAGTIAYRLNVSWTKIRDSIMSSINTAMPSILILLIIGSLAGTWLISGIVPLMIYYGLKIIHPPVFLFTALVVCCLVSLVTGSSWSTVATIGVALLGIGKTLGIHEGLVAGAIISGAYFGDKMSPLSDTTNLAPAVAGTDLFTHIRYMTITTIPSITLAAILFLVIGLKSSYALSDGNVELVLGAIGNSFNLNPLLMLVPVILIVIIIKKVPALPALITGTLLGAFAALIFQTGLIEQLNIEGVAQLKASYRLIMQSMFGDISIPTENATLNELFSTSGMAGMLNTVWLILSAMVFGGAMEAAGLLTRISKSVIQFAHSTGSLVASTIATCIFFNLTASDQYISIVVPGRMYSKTFRDRGLKPEVLSRTLEDAGTLTSVLVPWNTCGATQARVLGVSTLTYLPYCFFNIINPVVAVIIAYVGYKIRKTGTATDPKQQVA